MSSTAEDIKGPIVATAHVKAKPGKADKLAQWMANLKARANSDLEPGTLGYNIVRVDDSFGVWEEYSDFEAMIVHTAGNPLFQEFLKIQESLSEPVTPLFWPAKSLPEPTIRPVV